MFTLNSTRKTICIFYYCYRDVTSKTLKLLYSPQYTQLLQIRNGCLALGTWQGIYLNEHRDQGGWGGGHTRRIIITLQGQS